MGLSDHASMSEYLLGRLPEPRRAEFEQRYLADENLFEELCAAEDELIDRYLAGELSGDDCRHFEQTFLSSPRLRERVEFARGLREAAFEASALALAGRRRFRPARLLFARLVPAAAALVLIGVILFQNLALRRELARVSAEISASAQREIQTQASPAAFLLSSGLERGGGRSNRIRIPSGVSIVELRLDLGRDDHARYRAVIWNPDGVQIAAPDSFPPESDAAGRIAVFRLSALLLPPGDYILRLQGATPEGFEDLRSFVFRVVR